jgi:hypothetical protein
MSPTGGLLGAIAEQTGESFCSFPSRADDDCAAPDVVFRAVFLAGACQRHLELVAARFDRLRESARETRTRCLLRVLIRAPTSG